MDKILFDQIPDLFSGVAAVFEEKKEELGEIDARLGDGDLGLTMSRGFCALPALLRDESLEAGGDIGKLMMKAGMKMSSVIPSTMGFLMSSGIMEGGRALRGKTEMDGAALADWLAGFAAGVKKRGNCGTGQRTIYDALFPAAEAASRAVAKDPGASLADVVNAAVRAAESGMEATKDMVPVFGKAAVHAARSEGVPDQGAVAGYYVILGLCSYIEQ